MTQKIKEGKFEAFKCMPCGDLFPADAKKGLCLGMYRNGKLEEFCEKCPIRGEA